jgi:hypothetical protein
MSGGHGGMLSLILLLARNIDNRARHCCCELFIYLILVLMLIRRF